MKNKNNNKKIRSEIMDGLNICKYYWNKFNKYDEFKIFRVSIGVPLISFPVLAPPHVYMWQRLIVCCVGILLTYPVIFTKE